MEPLLQEHSLHKKLPLVEQVLRGLRRGKVGSHLHGRTDSSYTHRWTFLVARLRGKAIGRALVAQR